MRAKRDTYSKTLESFWSPHIRISAIDRKVSTKRFLFASVTTWFLVNTWYWYLWEGYIHQTAKSRHPSTLLELLEWMGLLRLPHHFTPPVFLPLPQRHDGMARFAPVFRSSEMNRAAPSAITRMRGFTITIETTMDAVDAAEPGLQSLELVSVIGFGGSLFYFKGKKVIVRTFVYRKNSWGINFPPWWTSHHIPSWLHSDCRRHQETQTEFPIRALW